MELLKKFIRYYAPYKAVFFLDLLCATIISVVDLVYPQLLRSLTGTLFTRDSQTILNALLPIAIGLFSCISFRACANIMSATRGT